MYVKELQVADGRGRRRHLAEFKAKLVEECRQPGMSVARVARDNGVNANLLHQCKRRGAWRGEWRDA